MKLQHLLQEPPLADAPNPVSKRRRRSTAKPAAGTPPSPKNKEAECNVIDILENRIQQPKVLLYHLRERMAGFRKKHSAEEVLAREQHLQVLHAAAALLPSEVLKLSDEEVAKHIGEVQPHLDGGLLPLTCMQGLLERACKVWLDKADVSSATEAMWPEDMADATFDPLAPMLAALRTTFDEKVRIAAAWWSTVALPTLMQMDSKQPLGILGDLILKKVQQSPMIMQSKKGKWMAAWLQWPMATLPAVGHRSVQLMSWFWDWGVLEDTMFFGLDSLVVSNSKKTD